MAGLEAERGAKTLTRTRTITLVFASVAALALVTGALAVPLATPPEPELTFDAPPDGALFGSEDVEAVSFVAGANLEDAAEAVVLELDGQDVTADASREGRTLTWTPDGLPDGEYVLTAVLDEQREERSFTIDTTPPELTVDEPDGPVIGDEEYVVTGTVDDPDATVMVGDVEAAIDGDRFSAALQPDVSEPIPITATDAAGNSSGGEIALTWIPSRVTVDGVRAVHASFHGWTSSTLRDPVLDMIDQGLINSVQLDLKDESGMVGYNTEVELAHDAGAVGDFFDLAEVVEELHDMGVHVSGRIVAFADPVLSRHEWENGDRDRVIQTADGEFYTGRYAGFINFAHPDIRQYNIDIAVEAAQAGIDDILWDYLRRPDGAVEQFEFAGLDDETPEESVASFVREADEALAPYGVGHGASLYGIAVDRPTEIAQDVDGMADHLDYVAPMLYPSHWGPGEYGVANPNEQPYDIIHESLRLWIEKVEDSRARVVPWLQDFSLGYPYGPAEVRAQIDAAADLGVHEWMLWDAGMRFTAEALPDAPAGDVADEEEDGD